MEDRKHFNPDDLLERAVDAVLRDPIPDELPPDQVAQLVAAVQQAAGQPYPVTLLERIKNMRLRTRIAVAASVLIILLGLGSRLLPGGGLAVAFADVAEALNGVHSATWKTTKTVKDLQGKTTTFNEVGMFLAPSHERTETIVGSDKSAKSIMIADGEKDKLLTLFPATKSAGIIDLKNFPQKDGPFGATFQGLRQLVAEAQSGKNGKAERLGTEKIDGRPAVSFRIQVGAVDVKLWADPKTLLPVRVEESSAMGATNCYIVMTDFRVNVDLDKSLFSLDLPANYTIQQTMQLDASKLPGTYLADMLKMAAESNDGMFPPELLGQQGIDGILLRAAKTMAEKHAKDSPAERMKQSTDLAMNLGGALGFLYALPRNAWHYAGKDVKLGTPNRPIFWVTMKRTGRCMVIYADLSCKEVSAEDAPKAPVSKSSPVELPPATHDSAPSARKPNEPGAG